MTEQVKETELPQANSASSPEASPTTSKQDQESQSSQANSVLPSETSMAWLVLEIEKIPKEYWPNLLQIISLYGESMTLKAAQLSCWEKIKEEMNNPDPVVELAKQKALSEVLRSWDEEGDEQEQKETWAILSKALDEGGVSI
jgi:hypothetical protein